MGIHIYKGWVMYMMGDHVYKGSKGKASSPLIPGCIPQSNYNTHSNV